jgi:DNA repair exonuclease SbcCD nuclease subunit
MKLAITSDLHLPKTPADTITKLVSEIAAENADAVIIAGDVGESSHHTAACLSPFRPIQCPILVLAGNHELFPDTHSSRRLWEGILPRTVQEFGYHWLEGSPYITDGIAIAGTIAWYDYSAAGPSIHESPKTYAAEKRYFTLDHKYRLALDRPRVR